MKIENKIQKGVCRKKVSIIRNEGRRSVFEDRSVGTGPEVNMLRVRYGTVYMLGVLYKK